MNRKTLSPHFYDIFLTFTNRERDQNQGKEGSQVRIRKSFKGCCTELNPLQDIRDAYYDMPVILSADYLPLNRIQNLLQQIILTEIVQLIEITSFLMEHVHVVQME